MNVRAFLEENQTIVMIVVIIVIAVSAYTLFRQRSAGTEYQPVVVDQWFFDLNTGELFIARSDQLPPIDVLTGPEPGVRARVFSCGTCDDPNTHFIGWLEKYPDTEPASNHAAGATGNGNVSGPPIPSRAMPLMADKDRRIWVEAHSDAGRELRQAVEQRCSNGFADECYAARYAPLGAAEQ